MSIRKFIRQSCALIILLACGQSTWAGTASFMTVADIHFDPFAECVQNTPCPIIHRLDEAPVSAWHDILATSDAMPHAKQDTNNVLLQSALKALHDTAATSQPQFIILLGDVLAHKYVDKYQLFSTHPSDQNYQQFVKKTMAYVLCELQKQFPNTTIYLVTGNNDSYQGDNTFDVKGAFFPDTAAFGAQLIQNKSNRNLMQNEFSKAGYYALDIPEQPALRLVALNSNIFSPYAHVSDNTAASRELDWFEQQLQQAHARKQHVLIAMHIPVGIDAFASLKQNPFKIMEMWQPQYTQRFNQDLNQYSELISGILNGHTHSDSFQIIHTASGAKIAVSSTPSISPFNGNNPGFKAFTYDTQSLQLQNYVTYYAALADLKWRQEYDFNMVYQKDNVNSTLLNGFESLKPQGELANRYQLYYDTTANTDPIHHTYNPYYWCQVHAITATDYQHCMATQQS
jgi:sphingomyelin phosphodiesterase acid-like 3